MNNSSIQRQEGTVDAVKDKLRTFISSLYQKTSRPAYATFSLPLSAIDPLALLEMRWDNRNFQYYWEKPSDDIAIAASGEVLHIHSSGPDRFRQVNEQIKAVLQSTENVSFVSHSYSDMMFLGGFSFFDSLSENLWKSFKPASFRVPEWTVIRDGKFHLLTITADLDTFDTPEALLEYLTERIESFSNIVPLCSNGKPKNGTRFTRKREDEDEEQEYRFWASSVRRAKELIGRQAFDKIVLARHISFPLGSGARETEVINTLRSRYSNCYNFLLHQPGSSTFIGSTPERLASFRNRLLLTEALAGSMGRGKTATEDVMFERDLAGSIKNRNEHDFVVQDIEQRLQPLVNSFDRSRHPEVKKLSNVQHLCTPIRAKLKRNVDILSIIKQLHPTPAVGGYPRKKAIHYIKKLENFERGWYAAPVGWLNAKGFGEFAVAIRSGLLTKSEAHFYAGCGIVADSDAASEWKETNLKLRPMLAALRHV